MSRYIDAEKLKLKVNHEMDMQDTYLPAHFFDIVDDMPAADVQEVKHGRWVYGNDFHWYTANCSLCGYRRSTDIKTSERWNGWRYCPNCGALMGRIDE